MITFCWFSQDHEFARMEEHAFRDAVTIYAFALRVLLEKTVKQVRKYSHTTVSVILINIINTVNNIHGNNIYNNAEDRLNIRRFAQFRWLKVLMTLYFQFPGYGQELLTPRWQ